MCRASGPGQGSLNVTAVSSHFPTLDSMGVNQGQGQRLIRARTPLEDLIFVGNLPE